MADKQITIYLEKHKYKALEEALGAEGKDLQNEIQARFDLLYEQTVPPGQRAAVDETIAADEAERQRIFEENRQYMAMRIKENGSEIFIESPVIFAFPNLAMACRRYLRKEEHWDAPFFADVFRNYERDNGKIISQEGFEIHAEAGLGKNLLAVYDVDLDGKTLSALGKNNKWVSYSMQDATAAAYHAFKKQYRPQKEVHAIFAAHLMGKEITPGPEQGQTQGINM